MAPFGPAGGYRQAGEIAAAVYNSVPVKRDKPVTAADVFPELHAAKAPERVQTADDHLVTQAAMAAAWGTM